MSRISISRAAWWRLVVGLALVLLQLGAIAYTHLDAQGGADRYFAWAPNDYSVNYDISATVNGQALDADQVAKRYQLSQYGFYEDPPQRLFDFLQRWETTYGRHDHTTLTVVYRLDGHQETVWTWSHG